MAESASPSDLLPNTQPRPMSSISLLTDRLRLSSLNEESCQQNSHAWPQLLDVKQTKLHIRRQGTIPRTTQIENDSLYNSPSSNPLPMFCSSQIENQFPSADADQSPLSNISPVFWNDDVCGVGSIDRRTDLSAGTTSTIGPLCSSPTHSHSPIDEPIQAKRACRSSSASSTIQKSPTTTYLPMIFPNEVSALEARRNSLPRPIPIRLNQILKSPSKNGASDRPAAEPSVRPRLKKESNPTARLSWHHPLFRSSMDSQPQHPSFGVSCEHDTHQFEGKSVGGDDLFKQDPAVACRMHMFVRSESANSSGIESLKSHFSAFTPTHTDFGTFREDHGRILPSSTPDEFPTSPSVNILILTPSSGFAEPLLSGFSEGSNSDWFSTNCQKISSCSSNQSVSGSVIPIFRQSDCTTVDLGCELVTQRLLNNSPLRSKSQPTSLSKGSSPENHSNLCCFDGEKTAKNEVIQSCISGLKRRRVSYREREYQHDTIQKNGLQPISNRCRHQSPENCPVMCSRTVPVEHCCDFKLSRDPNTCSQYHDSPSKRSHCRKSKTLTSISPDIHNYPCSSGCEYFSQPNSSDDCRKVSCNLGDLSELLEEELEPANLYNSTELIYRQFTVRSKLSSPPIFEVTFEPICATDEYNNDDETVRTRKKNLHLLSSHESERPNSIKLRPCGVLTPSTILIPISSSESEDSDGGETVLSPRLSSDRERKFFSPTTMIGNHPVSIHTTDIDLESVENN